MSPLRPALPALVAAFMAPAALGQATTSQSPAGNWTFKTAPLEDSCIISGEMTIIQVGQSNRYTCTFDAVQTCTRRLPTEIFTTQSCVGIQIGSQLGISSKLEKVQRVNPPSLRKGMDKQYAPDNFYVQLNKRGDEMDGKFESMGEASVKFRRHEDLVS